MLVSWICFSAVWLPKRVMMRLLYSLAMSAMAAMALRRSWVSRVRPNREWEKKMSSLTTEKALKTRLWLSSSRFFSSFSSTSAP